MTRDPGNPRSVRSARESIRWLLRTRDTYLDLEGLKFGRDHRRAPDQLDADDVLDRLEVLGVASEDLAVAVIKRPDGKAYIEVRVAWRSVEQTLAPIYPNLRDLMSAVIGAAAKPEQKE